MRIEKSITSTVTILNDIIRGLYALPAFQRPYVWQKENVLHFINSIEKDYPIGNIIIWSITNKARKTMEVDENVDPNSFIEENIANIKVEPENVSNIILDGANRISTLTWMLATPEKIMEAKNSFERDTLYSKAEIDTWLGDELLVLDIETKKINFMPYHELNNGIKIPISYIVRDDMDYLRKLWNTQEAKGLSSEKLEDMGNTWSTYAYFFRHALFFKTEMINATWQEAKQAFIDIRSAGVPFSDQDYLAIKNWKPKNMDRLYSPEV